MRRAAAFLLAAALALSLTGCATLIDGEYSSSRDHMSSSDESPGDAELTLDAADPEELYSAVSQFISRGVERGTIRMASYEGNLESDLADACLEASANTAMGSYCVYFINYSLNRLVSVYEASVSIIYRHQPEEVGGLTVCEDAEELEDIMRAAMETRSELATVKLESAEITGETVAQAVESAYYSNPATILYIPSYTVTSYPEEGSERIVEVAFTYPYATSTVQQRERSLTGRAEEIVSGLSGGTESERLMSAGSWFAENVTYDTTVNTSDAQARRYNAMTAYGALVQGAAVGEGCAMGLKVLCGLMGIECEVISGRFNNMDHTWNLVRLENGELYHVDMTSFDPDGAVFKNDEQQLSSNYWWDASQYPRCSGPSLYGPEFDPENNPTEPPPPPVNWE